METLKTRASELQQTMVFCSTRSKDRMTVTGIIAEFNPFHNGHKYLLEQAEGLKIVVMSGNFCSTWRACHCRQVDSRRWLWKADLVMRLPHCSWLFSRLSFLPGSGEILSVRGIDQLTFGTESHRLPSDLRLFTFGERGGNGSFLAIFQEDLSIHKRPKMWESFVGVEFWGYSQSYSRAQTCQGLCWEGIT